MMPSFPNRRIYHLAFRDFFFKLNKTFIEKRLGNSPYRSKKLQIPKTARLTENRWVHLLESMAAMEILTAMLNCAMSYPAVYVAS